MYVELSKWEVALIVRGLKMVRSRIKYLYNGSCRQDDDLQTIAELLQMFGEE